MTFEGNEVSELVRITVLAGHAFRGVMHRTERDYEVAPSLAKHAVARGAAVLRSETHTWGEAAE